MEVTLINKIKLVSLTTNLALISTSTKEKEILRKMDVLLISENNREVEVLSTF